MFGSGLLQRLHGKKTPKRRKAYLALCVKAVDQKLANELCMSMVDSTSFLPVISSFYDKSSKPRRNLAVKTGGIVTRPSKKERQEAKIMDLSLLLREYMMMR